ncbi:MAG: hypothetical protein NKF37_04295 [Tropheryma whipplei]|nr:hypothetical protein [Tropheryma whipplei]
MATTYTGSGKGDVLSVHDVTLYGLNGSEIYTYPTSVLTQGGPEYAQHTTKKPMTVIYTMNKRNKLPPG